MVTVATKLKLVPWKEDYDKSGQLLKSRDIISSTKVCLVKTMIFQVVMYGCENWTLKKAERQRIYVFDLWCWRRLLRAPWIARIYNQSSLKEISPAYSLISFSNFLVESLGFSM